MTVEAQILGLFVQTSTPLTSDYTAFAERYIWMSLGRRTGEITLTSLYGKRNSMGSGTLRRQYQKFAE
jgi:hypothetical protein